MTLPPIVLADPRIARLITLIGCLAGACLPRLADVHATELGLVLEERRAAHAVLAAHIGSRHPGLLLLDHADNLFLAKPRSLLRPSPSVDGLYSFFEEI